MNIRLVPDVFIYYTHPVLASPICARLGGCLPHFPVRGPSIRRTLVVNPGSAGQPKNGDPRAAYAIWEDGEVSLRRAEYDVEKTVQAYRGTGLEPRTVEVLAEVLRTGGYFPLEP